MTDKHHQVPLDKAAKVSLGSNVDHPAFALAPDVKLSPRADLAGKVPKNAESLLRAETPEEIVAELVRLLSEIDLNIVTLAIIVRPPNGRDEPPAAVVMGNFDLKWQRRYDERGYIDIDPRLEHCLQSSFPFVWDQAHDCSAEQKAFLADAAAHGIRAGISAPLLTQRGFCGTLSASTSLNVSRADLMVPTILGRFLIIRDYFIQLIDSPKVESVLTQDASRFSTKAKLSARERQVLSYAAAGLTRAETATLTHLSLSSVNLYASTAMARLGAKNMTNAIALALMQKQISLLPDTSSD